MFHENILAAKLKTGYMRVGTMSRGASSKGPADAAPDRREELLGDLVREVRQFNGLGASFFRAVASRVGMNATDLQVVDILDVTGLTTGAIAQMLNRLEEAGVVRRERDPADGRKVVVRLVPDGDAVREIGLLFDAVGGAWEEMAAPYDDGQLALLLGFVRRANAVSREELYRLREAPAAGRGGDFSAPLGDVGSGRLVFPSGITRLTVRADDGIASLYQARFEGRAPNVAAKDGVVTIRYPRRLLVLGGGQGAAEVALNVAIPWQIVVQGGGSMITAELGGLDLVGLEFKGGLSSMRLELPTPSRVVPIRISGGASDITIRRPAGVAARVHLKGWASALVFDDQNFSAVGNDVRLQSPSYDMTAPCYDIDVACSASKVTITTG
jgi:DNA-binding MarR family transcriptional regulator